MKQISLFLITLFTLFSCSNQTSEDYKEGWTTENINSFQTKLLKSNLAYMIFSEKQKEEFSGCIVPQVAKKYKFSELKNLSLKDTSNSIGKTIHGITKKCWDELLKNNVNEFRERGMNVVIPE